MDNLQRTITLDGPAASGKTSVGRVIAERHGYLFLDTGSMYRAATLAAINAGLELEDEAAVTALAQQLDLQIIPPADEGDDRPYTVLLAGKDVTWDLRSAEINANVSLVSSYIGVRQEMVRRQRLIGAEGDVIMVGRDIGTVVLPQAPLKLYMTASVEERARRRWHERLRRSLAASYDDILDALIKRDAFDGSREHSPMLPAEDAIIIDTTELSEEDAIAAIETLIEEKFRPAKSR